MLDCLYDLKKQFEKKGLIFCYVGPITQIIIEEISEALKRNTNTHEKCDLIIMQKIFSLFVELIQNIMKYSQEKSINNSKDKNLTRGIIGTRQENGKFIIFAGN